MAPKAKPKAKPKPAAKAAAKARARRGAAAVAPGGGFGMGAGAGAGLTGAALGALFAFHGRALGAILLFTLPNPTVGCGFGRLLLLALGPKIIFIINKFPLVTLSVLVVTVHPNELLRLRMIGIRV